MEADVDGVGDTAAAGFDDEAVGGGDGVVDVDRPDADIGLGQLDRVVGADQAPVEVTYLGVPGALARLVADVAEVLRVDAGDDRRAGSEEGHVADVIEVGVGDEDGVAMVAGVVAVKAGDVRQGADAEEAGGVEGRVPRHLEVAVLCGEALAEVEEDAARLGLDEDLVAADLPVAAVDGDPHRSSGRADDARGG